MCESDMHIYWCHSRENNSFNGNFQTAAALHFGVYDVTFLAQGSEPITTEQTFSNIIGLMELGRRYETFLHKRLRSCFIIQDQYNSYKHIRYRFSDFSTPISVNVSLCHKERTNIKGVWEQSFVEMLVRK
jgi:hypothetical protein